MLSWLSLCELMDSRTSGTARLACCVASRTHKSWNIPLLRSMPWCLRREGVVWRSITIAPHNRTHLLASGVAVPILPAFRNGGEGGTWDAECFVTPVPACFLFPPSLDSGQFGETLVKKQRAAPAVVLPPTLLTSLFTHPHSPLSLNATPALESKNTIHQP